MALTALNRKQLFAPAPWVQTRASGGPGPENDMIPHSASLPDFAVNSINLASPRLGAEAVYATDDFFADKARMLQDKEAVFIPDKYDENGKWMDGWESRRRRG